MSVVKSYALMAANLRHLFSMYDFSGQTFIVTGGGTGIGLSISKTLLENGANVMICGRRSSILSKAQEEIGSNKLDIFQADLSHEQGVQGLIEKTQEKFGGLQGYINNSGSWNLCPIKNLDYTETMGLVQNNLMTTILGTKHAANAMKKGGCIINMGSYAGLNPMRHGSIYSCIKSGVVTFTRSSASELAEDGIRVNCVIPGVIQTDMTKDHIRANKSELLKPIALKRIGTCQDVANGVAFLCSAHASYITGTTLEITGGKFLTQQPELRSNRKENEKIRI
jgi:NAD(P)-dependent dehydrogenase (short-subunit alcohol dehydrogenase family)